MITASLRAAGLVALLLLALPLPAEELRPVMDRIKIATVGARDVAGTAALYERYLDHVVVERGEVSAELAASWGAPAVAGRPYVLMQGRSGDDVFLRAIEVTAPEGYRAMTTWGWNAIEMIVEDPDAMYERLAESPFEHVGGPAFLGGGMSTIRAVQFVGPSQELFYFTTETGDRSRSTLLTPRADVDRPFIMVVAGPDARVLTDFYVQQLGTTEAFFMQSPVNVISRAQGLPPDHLFPLALVRLRAFSNSIEIDGYPPGTGPRPVAEGELPPGVSITSFTVPDLDALDPATFITPPVRPGGVAYGDNRVATIVGPAGELIELVEERDER
jgi:hypothetical protein